MRVVFKTHEVYHDNNQNTLACHPSRLNDSFTTQTLGGHMTSRNQGLSSHD